MKKLKISLLVIFFLLINTSVVFSCQDRAKIASLLSNMHTFQTILENYSIIHNSYYPENINELKKDAIKNNY